MATSSGIGWRNAAELGGDIKRNTQTVPDLKRMKEMESELGRLKRMYADLALENRALKDLIENKVKEAFNSAFRSDKRAGGAAVVKK